MNRKRNFVRLLALFAGMVMMTGLASCGKKDSGGGTEQAETSGEAFNLDLPLTYNLPAAFAGMMGLPQLSGKSLFDEANFKNVTAEAGGATVICESKGAEDGTFTGVLLLSIGGKKALRMTISLHPDSDGEFLYITEVSLKNLESGEVNSVSYDGTQGTSANLAGLFAGLLDYFYDKDKLLAGGL
jgi:hypothetical protein